MSAYSIKDLERLSGIKAHTIRIWEKRYSLFEPSRTGTNRRLYSDEDLRKIINVGLLTRHGIKISHISRLTGTELDEKAAFLGRENSFTENHIDSLVIAMIDLNEDEVNDIIMKSVMNTGFEETFENKVFPFLRKIGILWQTGSVNPAQEHFITNILRKRIIIATDSLPRSRGETLKRVLLFLPDSELHDLGLLYYSYLVKKNGNEMIYLGQMMPLDSLDQLNMKWKPDIIVTG
ncbi:MAG: MerR family transcriptional regulator, partial [Bacteroidia bacterium]